MGRAVTRRIAARSLHDAAAQDNRPIEVASLIGICAGFVFAITLAAISHPLASALVKTEGAVRVECQNAILLTGLTLPAVILASVFVGALEAHGRFRETNIFQGGLVAIGNAVPVALLAISPRVDVAVGALMVLRYVLAFALGTTLGKYLKAASLIPRWNLVEAKLLLSFAGWVTTSNLVGTALAAADRFVLAASRPLTEVTAYSIPLAAASRLSVLPNSVARALFPYVGARTLGSTAAWKATMAASRYVAAGVGVLALMIILFGAEFLAAWLGKPLDASSPQILAILALGAFFNSVAYCPLTYLQASGQPVVSAKLHLIETVTYIPTLILLAIWFGAVGVSVAWSLRMVADCCALLILARRSARRAGASLAMRGSAAGAGAIAGSLAIAMVVSYMRVEGTRGLVLRLILLSASTICIWSWTLSTLERSRLLGAIRFRPRAASAPSTSSP